MRLVALCAATALVADPVGAQIAQQAYLKGVPNETLLRIGSSVAVSGDTAVAGAPGVFLGPGADEAHVFVRTGTLWSHEARLESSNHSDTDQFGDCVGVAGDTIVVGAPYEDSSATGVNSANQGNAAADSGAAYVFVRSGTVWTEQAYLKASNTDPGDLFGTVVGISGDTIVVGAPREDATSAGVNGPDGNAGVSVGAAYVYVRTGTTWSQQAYLKASNPDDNDEFGAAVSISGDTIVVGAFREGSAAVGVNGSQGNDPSGGASGAAYVFVRTGTDWSQQAYLKASNTDGSDTFGSTVAISGNTAVIGAPREESRAVGVDGDQADNTFPLAGAAYVFHRSGTSWSQQAYLKASNTESNEEFGGALAVSSDRVVVGARFEDSAATGVNGDDADNGAGASGTAYLFVRTGGGTWGQQAYLKASNTDIIDNFGDAVAIDDETIVVGAFREDSSSSGVNGDEQDDSFTESGAAYVFDLGGAPILYCTAKTSSLGCLASVSTSNAAVQPVSGASDYFVTASKIQQFKNGLLLGGIAGPANLPFNGGFLCVQPPNKRGPALGAGGVMAIECSGSFSTLVNDGLVIPFGLDAGPGNSGWYQYWYRDPQNGPGQLGTALSNAVQLDFL